MADVVETESAPTTGLAFSGGGVRSAALCSGVLRRLLQRKVEPDYLSCVSGGGYTGTAYLDWKYRNEKKDDPEWHRRFFEHMRSRTGLLCNWQKPLQGIVDTLVLFLLVLLVSLVIPIVGWGSFACPLAYFINLAFRKILRADRYECQNITMGEDCDFPTDTVAFDRMFLFVVPLVCSVAFYLYSNQCKYQWGNGVARFMSVVSGSLFLYTFLPWFIHDYLNNTPAYIEGGVVFLSALLWFFVPFLRHYSSLVIIVYVFAYVVYWRVYEAEILGIAYSHKRFVVLLFVSGLVLCFTSIFGTCHLHLVHVYNRWRLQKAFYTKESRGKCGCSGIGCHDIFPGLNSCVAPSWNDESDSAAATEGALNLAHLKGIKPQYISNIVVNTWRADEETKTEYGLLTMSPDDIERVDYQPTGLLKNHSDGSIALRIITEEPPKNDLGDPAAEDSISEQPQSSMFAGKLDPGDVKLSEAMAASAAALSTHMGKYEAAGDDYKNILTILGLEMGASMIYNVASARRQNCCLKVLPYLIRVVFVIPLLVLPILYFVDAEDSMFVPIGIGSYFVGIVFLSVPAMVNTGQDQGCFENMARWLIVHVPFTSFMRSIFDVINTGPVPPAILHLSDGGHIENLAILPLLKRRLQRIVVVNGGYTVPDSRYGDSLVHALELARENLNCSFVGMDGRDVLEDIKYKFVNKVTGDKPRSYRFRVDYYDEDKATIKGKGEVILIAPRRPQDSKPTAKPDDLGDLWTETKALSDLIGCCCECCHGSVACKCWLCLGLCGAFPQHNTANQFFTPAMFGAYHREGYRACVEAEADKFLAKHDHKLPCEEQAPGRRAAGSYCQ